MGIIFFQGWMRKGIVRGGGRGIERKKRPGTTHGSKNWIWEFSHNVPVSHFLEKTDWKTLNLILQFAASQYIPWSQTLFSCTITPWISAQGTYFKFRRGPYSRDLLIRCGHLFNFSQIVAWHDHFFDTSSACKLKHKLCIDIKSWSWSLNLGTVST